MDTIRSTYDFLRFAVEYNLTRAGVDVRDERGAVSTEMAVVIAALVAIAVAAGVPLVMGFVDFATRTAGVAEHC